MTPTPPESLFERIQAAIQGKGSLGEINAAVKEICDAHDQRLREALAARDKFATEAQNYLAQRNRSRLDAELEFRERLREVEAERDELRNILRREDENHFEVRLSFKDFHYKRMVPCEFPAEILKLMVFRSVDSLIHAVKQATTPQPEKKL